MSPEHSIDIPWPSLRQIFSPYPCAFDREGNKFFGKPLPQLESELTALFNDLQARGTVLVTAPPQPSTIGALPIEVDSDCGCDTRYQIPAGPGDAQSC